MGINNKQIILKGQVVLDEESKNVLKEKIREEIIEDIRMNGNYVCEIEKFMNECDYGTYLSILELTLENVISRIDKNNITFNSDLKSLSKILAIKSILDIK